uniref:Uncharacterized protein n=1 Tax=Panagrolaimus superbus TaxID=310955 RepID=A0A914Y067_9BILA
MGTICSKVCCGCCRDEAAPVVEVLPQPEIPTQPPEAGNDEGGNGSDGTPPNEDPLAGQPIAIPQQPREEHPAIGGPLI